MASTEQVKKFIATLSELAIKTCNSMPEGKKVLPSICIAQSCLETGYGTSALMTKANAFFGIKAGSTWKGKVYSSKTKECYDGVNFVSTTAVFRAYDSVEDSVKDYYNFISGSSRYKSCCGVTDAKQCITIIKKGGYATDPDYVSKVMNIVNRYNLTQYDACMTGKVVETPKKEETKTEAGKGNITHKVVWGDTLTKIASKYSTSISSILELNKSKYPKMTANYIVCGWELEINGKVKTHKVVWGDTLTKIAKKYNTTVDAIVEANKTKYKKITPNYIVCGWELIV